MNVMVRNEPSDVEVHTGPITLKEAGLTLIHPFFNEHERFNRQFMSWLLWPEEVKSWIKIILVDDCSPVPIHQYLTKEQLKLTDQLNLSIFRIKTDLTYNTPGAINLGFKLIDSKFGLLMDSDCAFDANNILKFSHARPMNEAVYKFPRKRIGGVIKPWMVDGCGEPLTENLNRPRFHMNAFLVSKDVFFDIGGYDEDFVGSRNVGIDGPGYGFWDNDFSRRIISSNYNWYVWKDVVMHEWMPSAVNGEIIIRTRSQQATNLDLANRKAGTHKTLPLVPQNKDILRFEWEKTFESRRL